MRPERFVMASFLEIATPLIERRIPVIPVQPNEKCCLLPEWQKKATTDIEQVKLWNAENPRYNIGCVGTPSTHRTDSRLFDGWTVTQVVAVPPFRIDSLRVAVCQQ